MDAGKRARMHAGQVRLMPVFLETDDPICLRKCLTPHPIPIMGQDRFTCQGRRQSCKINKLITKNHCDQGNSAPPSEATRKRSSMPQQGAIAAPLLSGAGLTRCLNAGLDAAFWYEQADPMIGATPIKPKGSTEPGAFSYCLASQRMKSATSREDTP